MRKIVFIIQIFIIACSAHTIGYIKSFKEIRPGLTSKTYLKVQNIERQPSSEELHVSWQPVSEISGWETNNYNLPSYIKEQLRYCPNDSKDIPENRLVFCILHGGGDGHKNKNFYSLDSPGFQGVLQYAQDYLGDYNKKHNTNKVLHLLSYCWSGESSHASRTRDGKILAQFLNSGHYQDAIYMFLGYSYGCNVINETLKHLIQLQKNKKAKSNCIADQLIYFFPPCREPFFGTFQYLNNILGYSLSQPISYNHLLLFYSKGDFIAPFGAIDKVSGALFGIMACNMLAQIAISKENVFTANTIKATSLFGLIGSAVLVMYKAKYALYYQNIEPRLDVNDRTLTVGPKNQIQLLLHGQRTNHWIEGLLQHLPEIGNKLRHYPGHSKSSSFFVVNIDQKEKPQCFLDTTLNDQYNTHAYFTEENPFLNKGDFLNVEDMRYAEHQAHLKELGTYKTLYET